MRAGVGGVEFAGAERRADAGNTVGGHAHSDARSADQDAEGAFILQYRVRHGLGLQRIIAAGRVRRAEVMHVVPFFLQVLHQEGFKIEASVVGRDIDDAHVCLP